MIVIFFFEFQIWRRFHHPFKNDPFLARGLSYNERLPAPPFVHFFRAAVTTKHVWDQEEVEGDIGVVRRWVLCRGFVLSGATLD